MRGGSGHRGKDEGADVAVTRQVIHSSLPRAGKSAEGGGSQLMKPVLRKPAGKPKPGHPSSTTLQEL
jgi:hypothetical protein